jgi:flagellar hook-basal body complex protein FliE
MISAIQAAALKPVTGNAGGASSVTPDGSDFASMLTSLAANTVEAIRGGETAAAAGLAGTMPIQDVVDKVMAAEQALSTAIAVRDKIVAAYLEVSRMQI